MCCMCLGDCSNPKAPFVTPHCDAEQNTVRLLSLSTQLLGALSVGRAKLRGDDPWRSRAS